MWGIVLNKIDEDINRRVIGFRVAGYPELKFISDVIEHNEWLDMYNMSETNACKWGVYSLWKDDCVLCIHVPVNSEYSDEEYYELLEDDIRDFRRETCRKEVVESILRTAKNINKGYGVSFVFNQMSNDWVLGYKYPERQENLNDSWTELHVEDIMHYDNLTIKEADYLLEKLNK